MNNRTAHSETFDTSSYPHTHISHAGPLLDTINSPAIHLASILMIHVYTLT